MFALLITPEIRMMFKTFVETQEKSRQGGWVSCEIKNGRVLQLCYLQSKMTGSSVLQSN
jgi:hypothetical protein